MLSTPLCFLLLLGILGTATSFQAPPAGFTRAQWFEVQHINMTHSRCDNAMRVVNRYRGYCKGKNTFLHVTFVDAVRTCRNRNIPCTAGGRQNCHQSSTQVPLTDCDITRNSSDIRQCQYRQRWKTKFYVIACDPRSPRDSPSYPIVPVHLNGTV
ncbi:non-secretory ribonuclease-like [Lepus europaeus]|uniref:non-secretory ribonuclease-like n=1 Tax=Lepus europaeus TaxID=9983 RepID=UPI002B45F7F0|nr:non-secretory ribonuclease-like [Lepus europaeus]